MEVEVIETTGRNWSNPKSWPNGTVPTSGANVHIESGWNMSFDLNASNSPVYELVRVNGLLWFDDTGDRVFRAKHIFVRAGELWIGNTTKPF